MCAERLVRGESAGQLAWRSERAAVRVQDITVTVNDQTYTVDRYQLNEQRWGTGSVDLTLADGRRLPAGSVQVWIDGEAYGDGVRLVVRTFRFASGALHDKIFADAQWCIRADLIQISRQRRGA